MKISKGRGIIISIALFLAIALGYYAAVETLKAFYLRDEGEVAAGRRNEIIGVLRIKGGIFEAREIVSLLRKLRKNPRVKALVLRIDSPGGAVAPPIIQTNGFQ